MKIKKDVEKYALCSLCLKKENVYRLQSNRYFQCSLCEDCIITVFETMQKYKNEKEVK